VCIVILIVEMGEQVGGKNIYKNADGVENEAKGGPDADGTEMTLLNSNGQQAGEPSVEVC